MKDFKEQCVCIKFCFILGRVTAETYNMLKLAFGAEKMSGTQMFTLARIHMTVVSHPPYSSDLALCDFLFLLPKLFKLILKGKRCDVIIMIKAKSQTKFKTQHFDRCFQQWQNHLIHCVRSLRIYSTLKEAAWSRC
jgi:hypothetical protein